MITATDAIQGANAARGLGARRDRIVYWITTGIVCAVMMARNSINPKRAMSRVPATRIDAISTLNPMISATTTATRAATGSPLNCAFSFKTQNLNRFFGILRPLR